MALACGAQMLLQWHPTNHFQLPVTTPIIVVFLGVNGDVQQRYSKVLAKYISKRGWKSCVLVR